MTTLAAGATDTEAQLTRAHVAHDGLAAIETLGTYARLTREHRGLSIDGAAAQARVGAETWAALEEFGARVATAVTVQRILEWIAAA